MKSAFLLSACAGLTLFFSGCQQQRPARTSAESEAPAAADSTPAAADSTAAGLRGKVSETMNAAGYTYVLVDTENDKVWAAAPEFSVQVGDEVLVPEGMPMHNYHSKTLDRDFELVYFVPSVSRLGADGRPLAATGAAGHGKPTTAALADVDFSGLEVPEGGRTVNDLFARQEELAGQEVVFRGKVIKFNSQIMGKNWLHVQDGSGDAAAGTHDVTVTTADTAKIGDTVLVRGTLARNKDFGFGYDYDVLIEEAQVTVE